MYPSDFASHAAFISRMAESATCPAIRIRRTTLLAVLPDDVDVRATVALQASLTAVKAGAMPHKKTAAIEAMPAQASTRKSRRNSGAPGPAATGTSVRNNLMQP